MTIDKSAWSGDGDFTIELLSVLEEIGEIDSLRVEDAPASRSGTGYNFLVNEIFVGFGTADRREAGRWMGIIPTSRTIVVPKLDLQGLEARLAADDRVGPPDYSDEGMLQYLRAERVIPPYQTRGYKMVEMVRIYAAARSDA